jgi:hypothetical protein
MYHRVQKKELINKESECSVAKIALMLERSTNHINIVKKKIMMPTMEKTAENRLSRLGVFLYTEQYSSEIFNKAQTYQN